MASPASPPPANHDVDETGPQDPEEDRYPNYEPAKTIARYVTSRLAGNHVIFSPGFDDIPIQNDYQTLPGGIHQNIPGLINAVGAEIRATASPDGWGRPLIANHWGTASAGQMQSIQSQAWLNFQMVQSGARLDYPANGAPLDKEVQQIEEVTKRAREIPAAVLNTTLAGKAVLLGESIYDEGEPITGSVSAGRTYHRNAFRSRQTGYLGWMNGSFGFTVGVGGVWDWNLCAQTQKPVHCTDHGVRNPAYDEVVEPPAPEVQVQKPATLQTEIMGREMRLVGPSAYDLAFPREQCRIVYPETVYPEPVSQSRKMALFRDQRRIRAYLPQNEFIVIKWSGLMGDSASASWLDPRTGVTSTPVVRKFLKCDGPLQTSCNLNKAYCNDHQSSCERCGTLQQALPECGATAGSPPGNVVCAYQNPIPMTTALGSSDMVLKIDQFPAYASGWAGSSTRRLQAEVEKSGTKSDKQPIGVEIAVFEEDGTRIVSGVRVSDDLVAVAPSAPAAARDGSGGFAVVWLDDQNGDGNREVYLRWVDAQGNPIGDPVGISSSISSSHSEDYAFPQIAMQSNGNAVIVSQRRAEGTFAVVAWAIDRLAPEVGVAIDVAEGDPFETSWPLVASTPEGLYSIAWTEPDTETKRQSLVATVFDSQLQPVSGEITVSDGAADLVFPIRMYSSAEGLVTVEWEALGGEAPGRQMQAAFSAATGEMTESEVVLALHAADDPMPEVEPDWSEPLWGH